MIIVTYTNNLLLMGIIKLRLVIGSSFEIKYKRTRNIFLFVRERETEKKGWENEEFFEGMK